MITHLPAGPGTVRPPGLPARPGARPGTPVTTVPAAVVDPSAEIADLVDRRWRTTLAVTLRGPGALGWVPEARGWFRAEVERLEQAASRFRPDSQVAAVNEGAGSWVPVGALLEELVEVALAAAEQTDGLVSPLLGHAVDAAGYRSWRAGEVIAPSIEANTVVRPDAWQHLELARGRVRIPEGTALDLGATAKAWLADEVAEQLAERTGLDVVAEMGGDLRAIGRTAPWVVAADHEVPGSPARWLEVRDAGLATSGQGRRRWLTTQGPAHHLIDPRTGRSAVSRWWAASVLASTATAGNIASTAAILLDDQTVGWLEAQGLDALLTTWAGAGRAHQVAVGRWPGQVAA